MPPTSNRETFLKLIEAETEIGGRFRRTKRLPPNGGNGNFSLIFHAEDADTGQTAVLKFFNPDLYSDTYRWDSFRREATLLEELRGQSDIIQQLATLGQLAIPIQTTTGLSIDYDFHYYALELAAGDVAEVIAGQLWKPIDALLAFRSMCRAVARLHRRQIVHRDLKPDNFFILANGDVKLGDLGTACRIDGKTSHLLSQYQFPPGDLRYSAPEMFACLHDVDAELAFRADIFALGAVLFEIFTRSPLVFYLFDKNMMEKLTSIVPVPRSVRIESFFRLIESLSSTKVLPDIGVVAPTIPRSVRRQLNELYQSMTCLDYRSRLCDFTRIYSKINQCLIILKNEEQYRRWRRAKSIRAGRLHF